jgi:hypothetical protein
MREGEVVKPGPDETITCIRSSGGVGPFVFDLELAPGAKGPPTHTHDEGDELIEDPSPPSRPGADDLNPRHTAGGRRGSGRRSLRACGARPRSG